MNRYAQQMILPNWGVDGQQRLYDTSVLIIGAGGLGTAVAAYLASSGVGQIGILDFDTIEQSNLHRQILYTPEDLGRSKAIVLATRLKQQNPSISIHPIIEQFNDASSDVLINYSIICDCTDNAETRICIDALVSKQHKPLVHGAIAGWQGYLTVLHYLNGFALKDLFEHEALLRSETCTISGVQGAICGLIGCYMASEVVKIALGFTTTLEGKLLFIDTQLNTHRTLNLKKRPTI